ncbi:d-amino acid oxidase [Spathaspora passalidarum NRRL Y-27907]|uniref:D-amino acid oxidase n=1 Tax=Spathaspora passalidarum (strain NRRL Y-27907 / 11-Y1) TaxID=619300 RepID=G3AH48_SPAPN|nr:d-amino acid oxidase [Spathaspora passalidarum NRRL Y-27907]EGW35478.1 d-amino acid oxidase [Spathaspora passalidarum NRRL Y-27907]
MSTQPHIVIVGAGILGLSTALAVSEHLKIAHDITIIAEHGPHNQSMNANMTNFPQYTSPWAGAHFRPFPSKNPQEYAEMKLTRLTLKKFKQFAVEYPESSIKFVEGVEYLEAPDEHYKKVGEGYSDGMDNFSRIHDKPGYMGFKYDTWVVNSPLYLHFLYRKLISEYHVKFLNAKLTSLSQVNDYITGNPVIINCSGMGLRYNGGFDPNCFPIRGQTLLINPPKGCSYLNQTITYQHADGNWTFVIPRPSNGGIILGGTKQVGDSFTGIRQEDTDALLKRGEKYFPELMRTTRDNKKFFDILRVNVGLRPARQSGLNISIEHQEANVVINNYGAGGMGYELSYGSGLMVYEKLTEVLSRTFKL